MKGCILHPCVLDIRLRLARIVLSLDRGERSRCEIQMASCHIISMRVFEFCAHPVTRDSGSGDGDCQRWRGDGIHRSGVRKRVAAPGSSVSPLYSHFLNRAQCTVRVQK